MVSFKSCLALATIALANSAAAWKLSMTFKDGGQVTADGTTNSGCVNLSKTDSDIVTVYFEGSLFADTFELYHQQGCKALAYTAGEGSHNVPDDRYFSYQVY